MEPRFSGRNAIAAWFKEDAAAVEHNRRYQPTRTPCAVYAVGNEYYTATSSPKRRPKESDDGQFGVWRWQPVEVDGYCAARGWQIWGAF